jgi:septal ring factor EnvC (AmiA/AmiB activator)
MKKTRFILATMLVVAFWPARGLADAMVDTDDAATSMQSTLARLGSLEEQIVQARKRQRAKEAGLSKADAALATNREALARRQGAGAEASDVLERYGEQRQQELGALSEQLAARRQEARVAMAMARQAAGLLAWQVAAPDADARLLAIIALIQKRRLDQWSLASARVDRLKGRRDQAAQDIGETISGARDYAAFQEAGLKQLLDRQQALIDEAARLRAGADAQGGRVKQLAAQRDALTDLVGELMKQATLQAMTPGAEPTPKKAKPVAFASKPGASRLQAPDGAAIAFSGEGLPPATGKTIPVTPGEKAPGASPGASGRGPAGLPALAETPDEQAAEPALAVSTQADAGAQAQAEAGPRRLFWHATPVAVASVGAGRVAFCGPFAGYRRLLIVDLGDGWHVLYGNLSSSLLKVGDPVAPGQRVGVYQATQNDKSEPFWIEMRHGVDAVAMSDWPGLAKDWQARLFNRLQI